MGGLLFMAKANLPPNTSFEADTSTVEPLFMAEANRRQTPM